MNRLGSLILTLAFFVVAEGASATSIIVDPGPVGSIEAKYALPFSDLNGTSLDGQRVSLSFAFDSAKLIGVQPLAQTSYEAVLRFHTAPAQPIVTGGGTAFLTDEAGTPLAPPANVLTNGSDSFWAYFLQVSAALGIVHHGVGFDIALPDINGHVIQSGMLELNLSPSSREPLLEVMAGAPAVAEPASLALLSLGLLGLAACVAAAGAGRRAR